MPQKLYIMYHATETWQRVDSILRDGFRRSSDDHILGSGVYVCRDERDTHQYGQFRLKLLVYTHERKEVTNETKLTNLNKKTWKTMLKSRFKAHQATWIPPLLGMVPFGGGKEENCIADPDHIQVLGLVRGHDLLPSDVQERIAVVEEYGMKTAIESKRYESFLSRLGFKHSGTSVLQPNMDRLRNGDKDKIVTDFDYPYDVVDKCKHHINGKLFY